ncbi:hypothetical protein LIER_43266 [Lithospermum erythrorhizon]|uniref:Uncharacterized protein n=1 Tax=Lithospermum erythrorhizon TaxID=34254 RepID=A0AAV3PSF3_LITER
MNVASILCYVIFCALPVNRGQGLLMNRINFSSVPLTLQFFKHSDNQFESDLTLVVHSLVLSMTEASHPDNPDTCNAGCIRLCLVKLLQSSGYDAAVCTTKWQAFGKLPGGEHEFIDVINHQSSIIPERYIIDIDFRSNFEIARAVKPYDLVLNSLPSVYVGTSSKLKQFLKIMGEATTYSLKQNSMPLPPWRSLAYMVAKWESPCQRMFDLRDNKSSGSYYINHSHCIDLLKRVKSSVGSEIRGKTTMLHAKSDKKWQHRNARKLHSSEWI